MKQQLQATPIFNCVNARGMYNGLYIFLLMICGTVYSQPAMVATISSGSENFVYVSGSLYYSDNTNLYKGSATSAPALVTNTGESIIRIYDLVLGSNFFFTTKTSSGGERLWRSDGTAANTVQVTAATQITPLLVYNSQLFLRVNSSAAGVELWKVDGAYNASMVKDINPGAASGFSGSLITHDGLLYFFGNAGAGTDLWKSNGTTAGTVLSADLDDTEVYNSSGFSGLTSYNDTLYFTRNYEDPYWGERTAELWKSDGTTAGTSVLVTYANGGFYNYLINFHVFQGKLYFFHGIGDPAYVWFSVTDGTAEGTKHLERVTIDGDLLQSVDAESYILYYSHSQSFTNPIRKFDGTTTTTVHEFSMYHSTSNLNMVDLTYTGGRAFFLDFVDEYAWPQSAMQLFQADLATGVTRPVQEIYNMSLYNSYNITAANGSVFFTRQVSGEVTLWYYDPSGSPPSCEGTGNILQEIWVNAPGSDVRTFDFTSAPTGGTRSFTSFETTQYYANNYASRMRGTICVPQSGLYTFWISSDDQSELYLSTDPYEENKRLIAWVYGYTQFRNYDKYPSQKSAQIYLEADRKYYIEARHKEANGNDFVSVGWQLPDGTMQRPIPGNRLSAVTTPPNQAPAITITSPQPDQNFPSPASVNIAADVTDPDGVATVVFTHIFTNGGATLASFTAPPYQFQWNNPAPGNYQVRVTARDNWGKESTKDVFFTVQDEACAGTGTIVREIWRNIPGTSVSSIPVNSPPSNTVTLTSLSTPNYYANDYGSRIRGYVCAPATGTYVFWISGDDNSELWLSSDDNPANKSRIAYVTGATRVNQWNKYMSQFEYVELVQGRRYYIEVLHKEANGADHVEVGWDLPDGTMERPIPGNRLIPFEDPSTSAARFAGVEEVFSADEETAFTVYPNPAVSGKQIAVRLPFATEGAVDVDIKSITGVSVQRELLSGAGGEVRIDLKPSIATGMYLIRVANEKGNWSTKLQVK